MVVLVLLGSASSTGWRAGLFGIKQDRSPLCKILYTISTTSIPHPFLSEVVLCFMIVDCWQHFLQSPRHMVSHVGLLW